MQINVGDTSPDQTHAGNSLNYILWNVGSVVQWLSYLSMYEALVRISISLISMSLGVAEQI